MSAKTGSERTILVTGATGFVGAELLSRLLLGSATNIVAPVRAASDAAARARGLAALEDVLARPVTADEARRVCWVAGDLEQRRFGWDDATWRRWAERVNDIYHCAAATCFDLAARTGPAHQRGRPAAGSCLCGGGGGARRLSPLASRQHGLCRRAHQVGRSRQRDAAARRRALFQEYRTSAPRREPSASCETTPRFPGRSIAPRSSSATARAAELAAGTCATHPCV